LDALLNREIEFALCIIKLTLLAQQFGLRFLRLFQLGVPLSKKLLQVGDLLGP
jgi:hypothetical protein